MTRSKKPADYLPGTLVFIPRGVDFARIWTVVKVQREGDRTRYICHRVDLNTGLPMVCPDPRCQGKGLACCALTINGDWHEEVRPLTRDEIDLYSTFEFGTILDREFALKCLKLVPPVKDPGKATSELAEFLDSLLLG